MQNSNADRCSLVAIYVYGMIGGAALTLSVGDWVMVAVSLLAAVLSLSAIWLGKRK